MSGVFLSLSCTTTRPPTSSGAYIHGVSFKMFQAHVPKTLSPFLWTHVIVYGWRLQHIPTWTLWFVMTSYLYSWCNDFSVRTCFWSQMAPIWCCNICNQLIWLLLIRIEQTVLTENVNINLDKPHFQNLFYFLVYRCENLSFFQRQLPNTAFHTKVMQVWAAPNNKKDTIFVKYFCYTIKYIWLCHCCQETLSKPP